nr:hypothetical protein [Tanacetum cinerariifolium]
MVKKHDVSCRMCVDFKDLNKSGPKEGYLLSKIDWKVESLCEFPFKCFLDAYKGYHQIKMTKEDEEKTALITSQGIFFYSKMPFGLRNAEATYQHLVEKSFHKQIGKNLEGRRRDVPRIQGQHQRNKGMFLAKSVDKSLSFFKTLKKCTKKSYFHWNKEIESAFKQIKQLIAELPTLTAPEEKEKLIIYLAAAKEAVSAVLMTEREAKQMPIYFVSRALRGPPRVSVKGQILADFIVERLKEDSLDTPIEVKEELPEPWILFTDGSSCTDGSGARLILTNPEGAEFTYALRFRFEGTNNKAENEALITRLRIAKEIVKEADMIQYLEKVRALANGFKMISIKQVPKSENKKADALSKITSTSFAHLSKQVLVEELKEKSINEVEVLAVVEEEGNTWMAPIYEYLREGTLPA